MNVIILDTVGCCEGCQDCYGIGCHQRPMPVIAEVRKAIDRATDIERSTGRPTKDGPPMTDQECPYCGQVIPDPDEVRHDCPGYEESEKQFLRPINPDHATTMARQLKPEKK